MSQFIEMFGNPVTNTKGWKTAKIKDVAPEMPSKEQLSGKIWLLNLDMIESNTGRIIEKVYEDVENALSVQSFDEGNVLFSKLRPYLNKVVIPDEPGMATTELVPLRPEPSKLHKVFLSHLLRGNQFVNYANDIAGGTKMPRMPLTELRNFDCILPPMDKQLEFVFIAEQVDKSEFVGCKSQFIEMFGNQNTNDKGWTESLVKDEFKLSMGKTPARNNPECWDNGTHKWVSISDMSSYTRYTGDTSEYITDYAIADSGIKAVPKGTIIMSFKLSIGRTAITSEDLYTNEAIMAFAGFDEKKFNIDFLHFLIANKNWLLGAKQAVKGQTLNKESIGNAKIIIPPIEAQEEFASIYNQADKSEFVGCKSQFIEMFKEKGYPLRMLKSFADVSTGGTPSKANLEYWNGDKPWVSAEDMKNKYVYDTCEKVTEAGYATCKIIPVDTLMYVCRGSIGVMAINKIECATNQSICRAKCHDNVCNVEFLYHALMYQKDNIKKMGTGTSFKSLNQTSFSELKIELPPYNEQMKFVSIAQQADKSEYYN